MADDWVYEHIIRPALFRLDPEVAHQLAHVALRHGPGIFRSMAHINESDDLQAELCGKTLRNPVGLAAGFDKNGELVDQLSALGFGFAEIGSVTARPSSGNARPRLFRLSADDALINRMGLNGQGADATAKRLAGSKPAMPIAVNIAKTNDATIRGDDAIEDILYTFNKVRDLDLIYVALNASCPNTKEGCIQEKSELSTMLLEMQKQNVRNIPLFIKVSPDSSDELLDDIVAVAREHNVKGFITGNTTVTRAGLRTSREIIDAVGPGGLSGEPLRQMALALCARIGRRKLPEQQIIAVGGISTGEHVYEFLRNGASAVEAYTGLIYRGPRLVNLICEELSLVLKRERTTVKEAVGAGLR